MRRLRRIAIALALLWSAGRASAQSPPADDQTARARTHFEAGRALYQLGNYTEAVREFAAGYQLAPRPQFLLNLGQCYRKLNDLDKAREMYQRYLHEAPATDPERGQAQQILAELETQIADRNAPPAPSPVAPGQPRPASSVTVEPAAAAVTVSAPAPAGRKPLVRRNWWIFPVAAVVVGVGVGLGVYYGTRNDPCSGANLACWDLSKP